MTAHTDETLSNMTSTSSSSRDSISVFIRVRGYRAEDAQGQSIIAVEAAVPLGEDQNDRGNNCVTANASNNQNSSSSSSSSCFREVHLQREASPTTLRSGNQAERFSFDTVFGREATQAEMYERTGAPAVKAVCSGFNASLLCYGMTSSGKSYTMYGPQMDVTSSVCAPATSFSSSDFDVAAAASAATAHSQLQGDSRGIIPRSLEDLFSRLDSLPSTEVQYTVEMSVLEIYNENLFDLLLKAPPSSSSPISADVSSKLFGVVPASFDQQPQQAIRIREDRAGGRGVFVEGLRCIRTKSAADALALLEIAGRDKHVASTLMNRTSSRSHSLALVYVTIINKVHQSTTRAQLVMVDLAGSERVSRTGAVGDRLKEASSINLSLSCLGSVINKLTEVSKLPSSTGGTTASSGPLVHIPYRDSSLTRILSESLGGDSVTSVIICVSPFVIDSSESLSSIQFGVRCKLVKQMAVEHKVLSGEELQRAFAAALAEIRQLKQQNKLLEMLLLNSKKGVPTPSPPSLASPLLSSSSSAAASGSPAAMLRRQSFSSQQVKRSASSSALKDRPPPVSTSSSTSSTKEAVPASSSDEKLRELAETAASMLNDLKLEREERLQIEQEKIELARRLEFYIKRQQEHEAEQEQAASTLKQEVRSLEHEMDGLRKKLSSSSSNAAPSASSLQQVLAAAAHSAIQNSNSLAQAAAEEKYKEMLSDKQKACDALESSVWKLEQKLDVRVAEVAKLKSDLEVSMQQRKADQEQHTKQLADAVAYAKKQAEAMGSGKASDLLHEENMANARRIKELVLRNDKLVSDVSASKQRVSDLESEREELRREIDNLPITAELKARLLLMQGLKQQQSNFKKRLLACFSSE